MAKTVKSTLIALQDETIIDADGQQHEAIPIWERQKGEPVKQFARFTAYRLMGRKRSLQALVEQEYREQEALKSTKNEQKKAPKHKTMDVLCTDSRVLTVSGALKSMCSRWQWVERATAWDIHRLQEERDATAQQLLEAKYANKAARVLALNRMLELIMEDVERHSYGFNKDVKIAMALIKHLGVEMDGNGFEV